MFKIRNYGGGADYKMLESWWKNHGQPAVPENALPGTGLVVTSALSNRPIAALFVYKTDSAIAWLEWVISDNTIEPTMRGRALDHLIQAASDYIKASGFRFIFTSSSIDKLTARLISNGFQKTDGGMTHLIRSL